MPLQSDFFESESASVFALNLERFAEWALGIGLVIFTRI
jgi:hypothetical protein